MRKASVRLLKIHHIQLAMPKGEEEQARFFYGQVLGLKEVQKPEHLRSRGGCWFEAGEAGEGVMVHVGVDSNFHPAQKAHPAFVVDDLAGFVRKANELGFKVAEEQPLQGYDRRYVYDPFGNRIELMQELG